MTILYQVDNYCYSNRRKDRAQEDNWRLGKLPLSWLNLRRAVLLLAEATHQMSETEESWQHHAFWNLFEDVGKQKQTEVRLNKWQLSFLWYSVALSKKKIDSELICAGKNMSKFVKTKDSVRGEETKKKFKMIDTKLGATWQTNIISFLSSTLTTTNEK
jgi:hypothetical protein